MWMWIRRAGGLEKLSSMFSMLEGAIGGVRAIGGGGHGVCTARLPSSLLSTVVNITVRKSSVF